MRRPSWIWCLQGFTPYPSICSCLHRGLAFVPSLSPHVRVAVTAPGMRRSHNQMHNGEGLGQGVIPTCLFPFIMEGTFQKNPERWWHSQHANPKYTILACWIFHVRGTFCYTRRKRTSLSQKAKGHQEGFEWRDLLSFRGLLHLPHTPVIFSWQIKYKNTQA